MAVSAHRCAGSQHKQWKQIKYLHYKFLLCRLLPTEFVVYCQHTYVMVRKQIDDIDKRIGAAIAKKRIALGMTQEDLAGDAGMDRSYLSEIENGHKNISIRMLKKIADALKLKVSNLIDD
ncbi:MAG: hypothetical protein DI626_11840 [Micavibrio aeruginosavorus]|uniref:HTH cro/C1-type domain-containing protein n=1 Tax=Micavibrio aeruginosavorus TaxID=349221 RepID=A0A2W5BC75_9BACT|nr:MAG: hypothetical protein DI626_11840 [Micavibrio aeruginosavorus]